MFILRLNIIISHGRIDINTEADPENMGLIVELDTTQCAATCVISSSESFRINTLMFTVFAN